MIRACIPVAVKDAAIWRNGGYHNMFLLEDLVFPNYDWYEIFEIKQAEYELNFAFKGAGWYIIHDANMPMKRIEAMLVLPISGTDIYYFYAYCEDPRKKFLAICNLGEHDVELLRSKK